MLIRVKCPNGHTLKVDDRHSGKKGACPKCKALVTVPEAHEEEALEDDILAMLSGPGIMSSSRSRYAATREELPDQGSDEDDESVLGGENPVAGGSGGSSLLRMRRCPQCKKDVPPNYSVCPHCRVYLAEDSMAATKATAKCPDCGLPSFPGDEVCTNCGARLFVRK